MRRRIASAGDDGDTRSGHAAPTPATAGPSRAFIRDYLTNKFARPLLCRDMRLLGHISDASAAFGLHRRLAAFGIPAHVSSASSPHQFSPEPVPSNDASICSTTLRPLDYFDDRRSISLYLSYREPQAPGAFASPIRVYLLLSRLICRYRQPRRLRASPPVATRLCALDATIAATATRQGRRELVRAYWSQYRSHASRTPRHSPILSANCSFSPFKHTSTVHLIPRPSVVGRCRGAAIRSRMPLRAGRRGDYAELLKHERLRYLSAICRRFKISAHA